MVSHFRTSPITISFSTFKSHLEERDGDSDLGKFRRPADPFRCHSYNERRGEIWQNHPMEKGARILRKTSRTLPGPKIRKRPQRLIAN